MIATVSISQKIQDSAISKEEISDKSKNRYLLLYVFFVLCLLEVMPHLEILIQPRIRIFTPLKMIYALSIFCLVLPFLRGSKLIQIKKLPAIHWIILFVLSICLSSVACIDPKASFTNVVRYMGLFLFYAMVFFYIRSYEDIERFLLLSVLLGVLAFIVGRFILPESLLINANPRFYDAFVGFYYSPFAGEKFQRIHFLTWNANTVGYLAAFLIFIPLYFIISKSRERDIYNKLKIHYLTIGILFFFLLRSLSRGAFFSFIIAFIVVNFVTYRKRRLLRLVPVFFILSIFILISLHSDVLLLAERYLRATTSISDNLFRTLDIIPDQTVRRLDNVYLYLEAIKQNPLLGCGLIPPDLFLMKYSFLYGLSHFYYEQLIVFIGILGFFFYVMVLSNVFFKLVKTVLVLKRLGDHRYLLGGTLLGLFVNVLIKGFFSPLNYEIWLIMGLSAAFVRIDKEERYNRMAMQASSV